MRKFIIDEETLRNLLISEHYLSALQAGGVDNWNWYSDSILDYIDEYTHENGIDKELSEEELEDFGIEDIAENELFGYEQL